MVNTWFFSDWLYRPRSAEELDNRLGEGLTLRQGPVQVDIVRMIGGGLVESVRARTSSIDPRRPIDGSYVAFADFQGGAAATLVYSGHGYFDSSELTYGLGLQGYPVEPGAHKRSHELIRGFGDLATEVAYKESTRYGSKPSGGARDRSQKRHAFFGLTVTSCEKGDIRQTPTGLEIYGPDGTAEVPVSAGEDFAQRYTTAEINLMYDAWTRDAPLASHDAVWAKGTLEVCLAILESSRTGREVRLEHQTRFGGAHAVQRP
jgi:phthalate 4,5-cis-dihydrodiol dehydrogenase